jgi:hypothetical protein
VNDYWMCEHCKSLNRAGTGKCYSCHRKYGSAPKQAPVVRRAATPPSSTSGGRPIPGAPPPAGFFTGSSVGQGIVGPGGVPVDNDAELPAYLSRPIAGTAFTSTSYLEAQAAASGGGPIAAVKRRISAWVTARQSVSVWLIGYLSAGLITLLLVVGALVLTTLNSAIRVALQTTSLTRAWDELGPGLQSAVTMMGAAFAIIALLALSCFSIFVGLSTHNAVGMRAGDLWLTPGQAATCWWKTVWAQIKLVAGFLIPAGLLVAGYHLAGLIAALVAVELAQRSLDDPFGWSSNPARHLSDLYGRLGDPGSEGSLLGSAWKACFQFANGLSIVAYAVPAIGICFVAATTLAGRTDLLSLSMAGLGPVQLGFLAVGLPLLVAVSASLALLVPISIDLVERQRSRRTLARVGQPRAWSEPSRSRDTGGHEAASERYQQPEPQSGHGYETGHGGYDSSELVGGGQGGYGQDRDYGTRETGGYDSSELVGGGQGGYGQDRGYETRETGGYDDRGFGTGDGDRGYGNDQGWDTRR